MTSSNNQNETIKAVINALSLSNGDGVVLHLEEGEVRAIPISKDDIPLTKEHGSHFRSRLNAIQKQIERHQKQIDDCLKSEGFVDAVEAIGGEFIAQKDRKDEWVAKGLINPLPRY